MVVDFGGGVEVGPRELVGERGDGAEDVLAVVADFDRDGWSDLFVVATPAFQGDDPVAPSVSELRLGPFSARGRGQSDRRVEVSEPRAVAVADYNHDRYPDLAVYGHQGDGVYATSARLGGEGGLEKGDSEDNRRYREDADVTDQETPTAMPEGGLGAFYPACAGE
ncbi:FG-GAP-like repeat-containing protein [Streptomyces flavalbus]|uniref:FG-GAP-like repeat-containing protein n=1 Tax=Streptomyces flavalbus TaxID=2665155 RepID=A0ABW2W979_9ACTN